ncbi:unnamed protein product [Ilex paraguariensis]|uniref:Ribosomal eL28/Mak16 domain-containing protein n=1 Tax=Ilex paraguariensis TaxID=185542 RepID=A0ABC8S7F6_9AQUA
MSRRRVKSINCFFVFDQTTESTTKPSLLQFPHPLCYTNSPPSLRPTNPVPLCFIGDRVSTFPGPLIWEIVKKNNSFLVKEFGNGTAMVQFSKESNNLNSYKHSGLANYNTVIIQPGGKDLSVLLGMTKSKKQNKPASLLHKSVMKKEFPRMAKAVANQVADNYYRPDLKSAALGRISSVNSSLKVAKSGVKRRNRQAIKMHGRQ